MERCPTCQARIKEAPAACPRCKTGLTLLFAIEAEAASELRRASALLAEGEDARALQAVEASLRLKREPLGQALRGFLLRSPLCQDIL
jgi:hypothetical protein